MFFSVIVPTYNRRELLLGALASVRAQTFTDYEIIVVDDGSTDGTWEELQELAIPLRTFRQQNLGPGSARNLGATYAIGEYLAFLDSDDLWFPWTLTTYHGLILQYNKPAFIVGKPLRFREEKDLETAASVAPQAIFFSDYLVSGDQWRWWGASSFVVRRDVFESVGGFTNDWVNGEDADLALRLGTAPGFVQAVSPATFAYREHEITAMKNHSKTLGGTWLSIRVEHSGQYPGGEARERERWRIITRHVRPVVFDCLRDGLRQEAWELYRATFRWHLALHKWKYLAGFPVKALLKKANEYV